MWAWLEKQHRKKILATPFPAEWEAILEKNLLHYRQLPPAEQKTLRELTQVFVTEKNWEGCGGLALTDEIRLTIAGQACLLVLALPHDLYANVNSILVYPSTVVRPERKLGVFEITNRPEKAPVPLLGEAHLHGPVILVWDSILQSARHPETGHNLVYHEFAHKIDMADGQADGTPPLASRAEIREWAEICSKEFLKLRKLSEKGKHTFLDSYGAVNEAEFFAVLTEQFFDRPAGLLSHHPDLYRIMSSFYRQDPVARSEHLRR